MTPARAAEVLRYKKLVGPDDWEAAREMGAEALELLAWLFGRDEWGSLRVMICGGLWDGNGSFLDHCKAEWEKERRT
jgi:hypothetical protein